MHSNQSKYLRYNGEKTKVVSRRCKARLMDFSFIIHPGCTHNRRFHMKKLTISRLVIKYIIIIIAPLFLFSIAGAYTITSELDGHPVNVEATFTFDYDADLITVVIDNLVANPVSIIQNLSGLGFALDSGATPTAALSDSSAAFRDVATDGSYTESGPGDTGWELESGVVFPFGTGYLLYVLGTPAGPAHTLIGQPDGSNLYSNANGSIAGNGPHNPFIYGPATFEIDFSGSWDLLPGDTITGVSWYFGTEPTMLIPEPTTMLLLGFSLIGLAGFMRKFRKE
jgi:hypothetical protein